MNRPPMILNRVPVEKGAHLQNVLKSLVDEPPAKFPSMAPTESDIHPLNPPPHILLDPQKRSPPLGFPNRALAERMCSFSRALQPSLKIPSKRTPPRYPNGPLRRHPSPELFLKVPGKSAPLLFPNRVPMERDASSPEPMVYSFIYICPSPQLRSSPTETGKTFGHRP